jgi:4-amino-4-deoxy-L-arabinose transferase-like glycosyltransferase
MKYIVEFTEKKPLLSIVCLGLLARFCLASFTTLGNDEVYYVQYARYLELSYFDHPPFVGYLIRLTTFNLNFIYSELFVRLGSILIGTLNTIILFKLGKRIHNEQVGIYAALLYTTSFYCSVAVGIFILPDTPLSLFWILALYSFICFIQSEFKSKKYIFFFSLACAGALLSKYHGAFLLFGATIYFIINKPQLFTRTYIWIFSLFILLLISPVVYWNLTSPFSGINYHQSRVGGSSWLPNFVNLPKEFFGQIFYNNPFNVVLIALSLIGLKRKKDLWTNKYVQAHLLFSIPLIATTLILSFYNSTLPHWSGPGYFALILIAAYYLTIENRERLQRRNRKWLKAAAVLAVFGILFVSFQVTTGCFNLSKSDQPTKEGKNDATVDLGMWKLIGARIQEEIIHFEKTLSAGQQAAIYTHNWFPAAHLDYYVATCMNRNLFVFGEPNSLHDFARTNLLKPALPPGGNALYISTSNYYSLPEKKLLNSFQSSTGPKILNIQKGNTTVNVFIWELRGLN